MTHGYDHSANSATIRELADVRADWDMTSMSHVPVALTGNKPSSLRPSQHFFRHVEMGLFGLNQY